MARERAKFEKFDEYKTAAAELAQIRDGEKTELQKLTDQLAAVTAERDAAQRSSLVSSVAAAKGAGVGVGRRDTRGARSCGGCVDRVARRAGHCPAGAETVCAGPEIGYDGCGCAGC